MDESTVQFDEAELQRCQPVEVFLADGFTQVLHGGFTVWIGSNSCYLLTAVAVVDQ